MRAFTRGDRRRAKRQQGVPREANGRKSRKKADQAIILELANMSTALATRMRHNNVGVEQAKDPRIGFVLGRMFLEGKIKKHQFEAGCSYALVMDRYYRLLGMRPVAKAQDINAMRGSSVKEEDVDNMVEATRRVHEMRNILLAIGDIDTGRRVESTVRIVCLEDADNMRHTVKYLSMGLSALARYFRIPPD